MRTLVAGWFSFETMGASAGDLIARDIVCACLDEIGEAYDVALTAPFSGGVKWEDASPEAYGRVIFVCGPLGNGFPVDAFFERFAACELIGLNVSMLEPLEVWNPFDFLIERDSSERSRPDLTLISDQALVPVVGLVLIDDQPEYGKDDLRGLAHAVFDKLIGANELSVVPIDTRLDVNRSGLRTPAEVESLIARMDVVLTTRLHGMVLALKNGVPVVAIDSVAGGHKVMRQAVALGWPHAFRADGLEERAIEAAFEQCLTDEARSLAAACRDDARKLLQGVRLQILQRLAKRRS